MNLQLDAQNSRRRLHLSQGKLYVGVVPSRVPEDGHPGGSRGLLE